MLSANAMARWYWLHKWSSLVCTLFMLMLCITGLPLIFSEEIEALSHNEATAETQFVEGEARLQSIAEKAQSEKPDWELMFMTWDENHPRINAIVGPSMQAGESEVLIAAFDLRSGERLNTPPPNQGFMFFLLDLHVSMLMGLPGTLFLGLMGLVLVLSLISGAVVYGPPMRRLAFATVRKHRSRRIHWLDMHNMMGMITLSWVLVVGFTGVVLTMVTPLTAIMQQGQLADIAAPHAGRSKDYPKISPDQVMAAVRQRVSDPDVYFISWPGSPYATDHHFSVALRGEGELNKHLLRIAMVDAETGQLAALEATPWYMSAVNLSIPLHFGDYGGLPLKILWALLDIVAIIVLGSGVYLWIARRGAMKQRLRELRQQGEQLNFIEGSSES